MTGSRKINYNKGKKFFWDSYARSKGNKLATEWYLNEDQRTFHCEVMTLRKQRVQNHTSEKSTKQNIACLVCVNKSIGNPIHFVKLSKKVGGSGRIGRLNLWFDQFGAKNENITLILQLFHSTLSYILFMIKFSV